MAKPVKPPNKNSWTLDQRIGSAITGIPNPSWELIVESLKRLGSGGPVSSGGTNWFFGNGAPVNVVGSKPGDMYLDSVSGTVFKLES
jgi:hypothetical protein